MRMTDYNGTWEIFSGFRSSLRNETLHVVARKFIVADIRRVLSLLMRYFISFLFFIFFTRELKNQVQGFYGEPLFASLFSLHRSVFRTLTGMYTCICVTSPCGRRTSQNRYGTIRMMRVIHEDYCY